MQLSLKRKRRITGAGGYIAAQGIILWLFVMVITLAGCLLMDEPGNLVPPTVIDDPNLPRIAITVDGKTRLIHYRTYGSNLNPPLYIIHGSLADMRVYLPLSVLADKYYVVFWDERGSGLSERVNEDELAIGDMVEEIEAVRNYFNPGQQITLVGHSWSATFVALYIGRYPANVYQAIMMEPFGLHSRFMEHVDNVLNLTTEGYLDMAYASNILTPQEHESLDYRMLAVIKSGVRNFFLDKEHLPPWPVWRVGGLALIVWEREIVKNGEWDYDFTENLASFPRQVLFIGSSASPIGYDFQLNYNAPVFTNALVTKIDQSGHRLVTEQFDTLLAAFKDYLDQY